MTEIFIKGNEKEIKSQKRWGIMMFFFFFSCLIAIIFISFLPGEISRLALIIILIITIIIVILPIYWSAPMNTFILSSQGIAPPRLPFWMMIEKKNFIMYNEIKVIKKENIRYNQKQPKEGLWFFELTLKNNKQIVISVRDIGNQFESGKQLKKIYHWLDNIMKTFETLEKNKSDTSEEIIISRQRCEP